jgi:hypothetical protein
MPPVGVTMTIFDLPPMNTTLSGLSTPPIRDGAAGPRFSAIANGALSLSHVDSCPAFPIDRRRKMGKFILPIWLCVTMIGSYFMLYQSFPPTHFDELKKRHEVKREAANL